MKTNKPLKTVLTILLAYVALVVLFESSLGYFQPEAGGTIVISTTDSGGYQHDRVVSRFETNDALYIAVNHWPRAWYRRILEHPGINVSIDGESGDYLAILLEGAERELLAREYNPGLLFRVLTGFPPRHFLRLDPLP